MFTTYVLKAVQMQPGTDLLLPPRLCRSRAAVLYSRRIHSKIIYYYEFMAVYYEADFTNVLGKKTNLFQTAFQWFFLPL